MNGRQKVSNTRKTESRFICIFPFYSIPFRSIPFYLSILSILSIYPIFLSSYLFHSIPFPSIPFYLFYLFYLSILSSYLPIYSIPFYSIYLSIYLSYLPIFLSMGLENFSSVPSRRLSEPCCQISRQHFYFILHQRLTA